MLELRASYLCQGTERRFRLAPVDDEHGKPPPPQTLRQCKYFPCQPPADMYTYLHMPTGATCRLRISNALRRPVEASTYPVCALGIAQVQDEPLFCSLIHIVRQDLLYICMAVHDVHYIQLFASIHTSCTSFQDWRQRPPVMSSAGPLLA